MFYSLILLLDTDQWLTALLPAVLSHELGHLFMIRATGGHIRSVRLEASGLCINADAFSSRRQELLCIAGGPAAGFVWAVLTLFFTGRWWIRASAAAFVINFFNLLPAMPLDGGRLLSVLTCSSRIVRGSSWITAGLLLLFVVRLRTWGLIVPSVLIVKTCLSP